MADVTGWQIGGKALLVTEKARNVMTDICLPSDVEFLPFDRIKSVDLFAVNVLRVEDYLDHSLTEFMPGAGIPRRVSWRPDLSAELPPLFKVFGGSGTYASASFAEAAVVNGLTGLRLADPSKDKIQQILRGEQVNAFPGL